MESYSPYQTCSGLKEWVRSFLIPLKQNQESSPPPGFLKQAKSICERAYTFTLDDADYVEGYLELTGLQKYLAIESTKDAVRDKKHILENNGSRAVNSLCLMLRSKGNSIIHMLLEDFLNENGFELGEKFLRLSPRQPKS